MVYRIALDSAVKAAERTKETFVAALGGRRWPHRGIRFHRSGIGECILNLHTGLVTVALPRAMTNLRQDDEIVQSDLHQRAGFERPLRRQLHPLARGVQDLGYFPAPRQPVEARAAERDHWSECEDTFLLSSGTASNSRIRSTKALVSSSRLAQDWHPET